MHRGRGAISSCRVAHRVAQAGVPVARLRVALPARRFARRRRVARAGGGGWSWRGGKRRRQSLGLRVGCGGGAHFAAGSLGCGCVWRRLLNARTRQHGGVCVGRLGVHLARRARRKRKFFTGGRGGVGGCGRCRDGGGLPLCGSPVATFSARPRERGRVCCGRRTARRNGYLCGGTYV